jgi:glutathione S-transferase
MYRLFYSPGTASLAVHWMLIEVNAPFEVTLIDFDSKQQKSADYLKLNPNGMVPTLIVEGVARTECAALLMLLAERHPETHLAPSPGTVERADYLQWMFYFANTLQPAFRSWFYPDEPAGESNIEAAKAQAHKKIETVWDRVDTQLDGRQYVVGDSLTAVDFLATMLMRWARNMPRPATDWPNIKRYVERMRALPSYVQVHKSEGLSGWLN